MKKSLKIACIVAFVFTIASCGKTEKILVKKDGLWNIDQITTTTETTGFPATTDTETDQGTIEFNDNGTGVITYSDGTTESFTWEVNEDSITITMSGFDPLDYDILESSKDSQEWEGVSTFTIAGITSTVTINIQLSRI